MATPALYTKAFNDLLDQFYEFLSDQFPSIAADILIAKTFTDFLKMGNPREVSRQFLKHIDPYTSQILACDEDFFINYQNNIKGSDEILIYGPKLLQVWKDPTTTDRQKAEIWMFFHKLIKLGSKC